LDHSGQSHWRMLLVAALMGCGIAHGAEHFDGSVFYLGDIHAHSGVSLDGGSSDVGSCTGDCGSLADISTYARSQGLDFLALTDHVNGPSAGLPGDIILTLDRMAEDHDPEGGFVTIPGAELTFYLDESMDKIGHKSLLLFGDVDALSGITTDDIRPGPTSSTTVAECADIWAWMDGLIEALGPAMLIPHHPALNRPMPTDWACHDSAYSPAVEVYSEQGSSMGLGDGFAPPWSGEHALGTVATALGEHAYRLGFLGGSDNHDSRPGDACAADTVMTDQPYGQGFTVAVIDEDEPFDRAALYAAFTEGRTYATTGPLIPAQLHWIDAVGGAAGMGAEMTASSGSALALDLRVPAEVHAYVVEVWVHASDGSVLATPTGEDGAWSMILDAHSDLEWAFVELRVDGALWYAGESCEDVGHTPTEVLWFSPTYFSVVEDFDGDGWTVEEGDCDDYEATVHPLGFEDCDSPGDEDCNGLADESDSMCAEDTGDSGGAENLDPDTAEDEPDTDTPGADSGTATADSGAPSPADAGFAPKGAECGGCAASGGPGPWWWLPGLALVIRRRR
jgi:hypothetical protein